MAHRLRFQLKWKLVGVGAAGAFALACSTVTELPPREPTAGNAAQARQFHIECIELDQCKREASVACRSRYSIVSEWHNTIPESELPGLNEGTRPKDFQDWENRTLPNRAGIALPNRTGIESDEPMPLASIVVACNG
jgi:hypothetical protein